ncbi:ABC transporter substrate-binding protein [Anaerovorax sp. IOR16]|uniref:ABC transporter substrate-binding protein n=1 Tax=Anaerovorax sp. IOR16 TaxID=2773458 RepID=UPI0019D09920|nr:substrate-binding domain-containing protein [Anaerovorax sp. IOR16]
MEVKKIVLVALLCVMVSFTLIACGGRSAGNQATQQEFLESWVLSANLEAKETPDELYKAALEEDILTIYSVTTRLFDTKKYFETAYPGLTVEIKDIRSKDAIKMIRTNYDTNSFDCDMLICSDSAGNLYNELIEPGLILPYIPWDIEPRIKSDHINTKLNFLDEVILFAYNSELYQQSPISNIWEITENKYKDKIVMASPLSSFTTYGFCATVLKEEEKMLTAYKLYFGTEPVLPKDKSIGEYFWEQAAENIVFVNTSDEVAEGIGTGDNSYALGIMLSSKLRLCELGYSFEPIYELEPFAAVYTPNSVMLAAGAKNINSAKLFIRFLLGETDGTGEGYKPFCTSGTWSCRDDVADGNDIPLDEIDVIKYANSFIDGNTEYLDQFFKSLLKENITQ